MPNINVVEAQTVLEGYKLLQKQANGEGLVLSDFKRDDTVTGTWISEYIGLEVLWETCTLGKIQREHCWENTFCNAHEAGIRAAHVLVNWGRVNRWGRND